MDLGPHEQIPLLIVIQIPNLSGDLRGIVFVEQRNIEALGPADLPDPAPHKEAALPGLRGPPKSGVLEGIG